MSAFTMWTIFTMLTVVGWVTVFGCWLHASICRQLATEALMRKVVEYVIHDGDLPPPTPGIHRGPWR